jgi:acyl-coenzyme A synthetase/AMP-(fatty) acid ligase
MDRLDSVRSWLEDDRLIVIQDGESISSRMIAERADRLTERLGRIRGGRIAIATERVDSVIAALVACQATGKQLFVLRESYPIDDPVWEVWGVDSLLDAELRETQLSSGGQPSTGPGIILTTSGTTGKPKIVLHDLERLFGRIRRPKTDTKSVRWLLTYHPGSFAGMQVMLTAVSTRGELIATARRNVAQLAEAAFEYRATHISGTPTFWRSFLLDVIPLPLQLPLQQITLGGEAADQRTLDQLRTAFPGARISHIYASTEAGALFAVNDGRAGFPAQWLTDGVDGTQLRIREGVLEVLSPRAMRSYLKDGALKDGALVVGLAENEWIKTGDLVELVDGRVMFRGREDNLINVGGAKVTPEEVETALLKVPCVRESRVYAVRNPLTGALVAADVVLDRASTENAARKEIMTQLSLSLERHKLPRILNFVEAIPISKAGKKERYGQP